MVHTFIVKVLQCLFSSIRLNQVHTARAKIGYIWHQLIEKDTAGQHSVCIFSRVLLAIGRLVSGPQDDSSGGKGMRAHAWVEEPL